MSLMSSIEMLTREHKTMAHTIDGLEVHTRPALLHLLRDAVFGGMEKTGGSGSKARLPISEAALDLYRLIDQQISEVWAQAHNVPPNADKPEALAAQWGALVQDDAIFTVTQPEQHNRDGYPYVIQARYEFAADQLAERWVEQIETFFDPPSKAEIQAACIQCGERWTYSSRDGETIRSSALVFNRDHAGNTKYAECLVCGTTWTPDQFRYLAEAITTSEAQGTIEP